MWPAERGDSQRGAIDPSDKSQDIWVVNSGTDRV